jgi:hypothetical protein
MEVPRRSLRLPLVAHINVLRARVILRRWTGTTHTQSTSMWFSSFDCTLAPLLSTAKIALSLLTQHKERSFLCLRLTSAIHCCGFPNVVRRDTVNGVLGCWARENDRQCTWAFFAKAGDKGRGPSKPKRALWGMTVRSHQFGHATMFAT